MPTHPEVLWAQRSHEVDETKNIVYLTVNLIEIDASSVVYDLSATGLNFKAKSGDKEYEFAIQFFEDIVPEESTHRLTTRSLSAVLRKKNKKAEFWPRLTKEKVKLAFVKTDFSKWVDEDEQDGEPAASFDDDGFGGGPSGPGGMDFGNMMSQFGAGGMGGMPGMGGMGGMPGMDFGGGDDDDDDHDHAGHDHAGHSHAQDDDDDDDDGPPPLEEVETK
ncbi:HSP20-like chaperone [Exidia glandulosa HHB12029]|uniref:HSP20-like chaperone n=1 Tax=Exidia glandulosa HHB12029 TaxID=1314781 RepID=A0A165EZC0_EXIGL|nr:HSP20-like chaperone [Exidia glandulosa HHB12029]